MDLSITSHHLFRYPSEWDPRQTDKTKGGYPEGSLKLPKNFQGDLRIMISTFPGHNVEEGVGSEMVERHPEVMSVHPTMIHVVRKGKGNRRLLHKEPVPSADYCSQEFLLIGDTLKIKKKLGLKILIDLKR